MQSNGQVSYSGILGKLIVRPHFPPLPKLVGDVMKGMYELSKRWFAGSIQLEDAGSIDIRRTTGHQYK